ncbi:MAG: hypothetical protein JWN17_1119 [Frankiales bacterium]|nr:hypothetical protein [Frankiales bacterium]
MLAVSCLTCAVSLARPVSDDSDDDAAVRSFLTRHDDSACVAGLDLQAVRPHLA